VNGAIGSGLRTKLAPSATAASSCGPRHLHLGTEVPPDLLREDGTMTGSPLVAVRSALARGPARAQQWDRIGAVVFFGAVWATRGGPAGLRPLVGVLLMTVPLGWRRRSPMVAFIAQLSGIAVVDGGVSAPAFVAVMVGAYSVAAYSGSVIWSVTLLLGSATWVAVQFGNAIPTMPDWLTSYALVVPVWLMGVQARRWRVAALQADEHARTARRAGELAAQQAVAQQKAHIAREMHDIIGHNVSVMVVQAAAARQVLDSEPEFALAAMAAIERFGQEAMSDLRHILDVLRDPDDAGPELRPQASWEQFGELVERVRNAGLPVTTVLAGVPPTLPPSVGLVAYRVVQEALTNVLRHAKGSSAEVRVDFAESSMVLVVANTAATEPSTRPAADARGLIGLAERVHALGGEFDAGPRINGGFRVRACLPVAPT
jgi:signal transduction histidine kinase